LCPTSGDLGAMGSGVVDILCRYWVSGVSKTTCSAMCASMNVRASLFTKVRASITCVRASVICVRALR